MVTFLLDSNVIIYHLGGAHEATAFVQKHAASVAISAVTRMEVLGFPFPTPEADAAATSFVNALLTYPISPEIVESVIAMRRRVRIKIPDALIAATALSRKLALVTRNGSDFAHIQGLTIVDPFVGNA